MNIHDTFIHTECSTPGWGASSAFRVLDPQGLETHERGL